MPVDLGVGNSIIQAYNAGRQEFLERQKNQQTLAQQAIENRQRQETIDAQMSQFKENQQREKEQFQAQHELAKSSFNLQQVMALPEFQKLAETTGQIPGATQSPYITQEGSVDPTRQSFQLPQALGGFNINARTPEEVIRQEVSRQYGLLG